MAIYSTVTEKCNEDVREVREILSEFNIPENVAENILDIIKETYFQLNEAFASGRAMERIIQEITGTLDVEYFKKYTKYVEEETFKFPFELEDDNEE